MAQTNDSKYERMDDCPTEKELEMLMISKDIPDLQVLEKKVLKAIIGQDKQIKRIITAIYRSIYLKSIKANVLVIGNSGTGKTATIEQIAKNLKIPITIEDATKYTQEGYVGSNVDDMIENLIENADYDIERAEKGIIVIDEIDKKVGGETDGPSSTKVLKSLLKIIEGATIRIADPSLPKKNGERETILFDTRNIIIIFTGAFEGIDKIRDKRLNKKQLGFSSSEPDSKIIDLEDINKQDLVEYGMPKEFVSRIDTIVEMNDLGVGELVEILKKSNLSIMKKYRAELKGMNIKLSFNPKLYDKIAEQSLELNSGARELSNIINKIFENILYEIFTKPGVYTSCKLGIDILTDNTDFELS